MSVALPAGVPDLPGWGLGRGDAVAPGRTVVDRLGGGNDVEVFLVWDERRFALAVAKVLRPHRAADDRARAHLAREAALLERLAHPCLPRGYGVSLEGERPHLLLEWVEGPTLRRLVRRGGPLAREQAVPLAAHLAGALQYLANESIVHLDVKPANVIVGIQPKLVDLGIARPVEEAARLRVAIGTEGWMPPEQVDPVGAGGVGPAADVWALGATLHFALSGEKPFPRGVAPGAVPAPLPPDVPAPLAALVRRMLSPVPADRPAPREIVAALEPLVGAR